MRSPPRSAAEKNRAVKSLKTRGDRPVSEVCSALGVSPPTLYYWQKHVDEKGPFTDERPTRKPSTAITRVPASSRMPAHEVAIEVRPAQLELTLTASERDELVLLRADNARLKAALVAALELGKDRRP